MINDEADQVIKELFDSVLNRYQNYLESVKGIEFVFGFIHLQNYKHHKINPSNGGSYIDSPEWIKKATLNRINKMITNVFNTL